mmetsp:Transcript_44110/g.67650  ORF Transcript_44110/g.67650 Transcript_44110/m.67650 type:complete len:83 (+) Transcript_44110:98-346(+)
MWMTSDHTVDVGVVADAVVAVLEAFAEYVVAVGVVSVVDGVDGDAAAASFVVEPVGESVVVVAGWAPVVGRVASTDGEGGLA